MKKLLAFVLVLAALAPAVSAQTAGAFTGKWEGTFTRVLPDGTERTQALVFNLTQKGKALTGTGGPPEQQTEISNGAVAAGKATFDVKPSDAQVFKFTLTIVKGRLQGEMIRVANGAVSGKAKVDAAKAAAPAKVK